MQPTVDNRYGTKNNVVGVKENEFDFLNAIEQDIANNKHEADTPSNSDERTHSLPTGPKSPLAHAVSVSSTVRHPVSTMSTVCSTAGLNQPFGHRMSFDLPVLKPDTIEEVFSDKCQRINLDYYSLYHFDELTIDGRKYHYRLSSNGDFMTVVGTFNGQSVLMVSVWTNMDHQKRLREIHQCILKKEMQGDTLP
nr:unnamed protein product [Spirometra erinaceieuropaei]